MKVLDTYRPGPGQLALLLKCKCVVTLDGHRGRAPIEHPCKKHDTEPRTRPSPASTMPGVEPPGRARRSSRRRPGSQGERTQAASPAAAPPPAATPDFSRPEDRGLSAGTASTTATPISASPSAERSSTTTRRPKVGACAQCRKILQLAAKGLCWGCYGRSRKPGAEPLRGPRRRAAAASSPPAAAAPSLEGAPPVDEPELAVDEVVHTPADDLRDLGSRDIATSRAAAARVGDVVRAGNDAGVGYARYRQMEQQVAACEGVRRAVVELAHAHRTESKNPEGFARAVEEVLRAAAVAEWLNPDPEATRTLHGQRTVAGMRAAAGRRDGGTAGRRDGGTAGRRDGGTAGRRDGGTAGRRDGGTAGRRDGGEERLTPEEFRARAARAVGPARAAQALRPHGDERRA